MKCEHLRGSADPSLHPTGATSHRPRTFLLPAVVRIFVRQRVRIDEEKLTGASEHPRLYFSHRGMRAATLAKQSRKFCQCCSQPSSCRLRGSISATAGHQQLVCAANRQALAECEAQLLEIHFELYHSHCRQSRPLIQVDWFRHA